MKIVNGYRVYDKSELFYHNGHEPESVPGWKNENYELMYIREKYFSGYRTLNDFWNDSEKIEKGKKEEKHRKKMNKLFYPNEEYGWLIYFIIMICGNIFKGWLPYGMIMCTIYFLIWRHDYRKQFDSTDYLE